MEHKGFFVDFFKHYLPSEVFESINWETARFLKISGEHLRVKDPVMGKLFNLIKDIGDLAYLVEKKDSKSKALIYLHVEHQSSPDRFIPLRTALYILGALYEQAQLKPNDPLPEVYSIIYYHGKKPYPYVTKLWDMFDSSYCARQYLFDPQFVDLNKVSDQELLEYDGTASAEFAFKHIFDRFDEYLEPFIQALSKADRQIIASVVRYIFEAGKIIEPVDFFDRFEDACKGRGDNMATVADYLRQQGAQKTMQKVAADMYKEGIDVKLIKKITGLSEQDLSKLRNQNN